MPPANRWQHWYGLAVLVLLYVVSMIDRSIISMLIGPIKQDLRLDDFQASLLMGTAFGIAYVLAAFPFGWAADRFPRPLVIAFGIAFWSLACASGGLAAGFAGLFVSRMMVGAGEAAMSPCAYSLMAGWFPRRQVSVAMGIYHFGGAIGASIAMIVGGAIAQWAASANAHTLFAGFRPWQVGFLIVGLPGLPLALLALTLREPRAASPRPAIAERQPRLAPFLNGHVRLILCHFAAFSLTLLVVYGVSYWTPQFLIRSLRWSPIQVGSTLAALNLGGVLAGQIAGVSLIGWFDRLGYKDAALRAFGFALATGLTGSVIAFTATKGIVVSAGIFLLYAGLNPVMTYGSSALQLFVPAPLRGRMSALYLSVTSLAGLGMGPAIVGLVTEYGFGTGSGLRLALLMVSATALVGAFLLLLIALAPYRRAIAAREAEDAGGVEVAPAPTECRPATIDRMRPAM